VLGDERRVLGSAPQRCERPTVAERSLSQAVRHLGVILVRQGEGEFVFAGLDQNAAETLGGETLKLVQMVREGVTLLTLEPNTAPPLGTSPRSPRNRRPATRS
jgi:hypothetical protein